jgi:hypothetical protein
MGCIRGCTPFIFKDREKRLIYFNTQYLLISTHLGKFAEILRKLSILQKHGKQRIGDTRKNHQKNI